MRAYDFFGEIRSLELTHGGNGWHPHFHIILFFGPGSIGLGYATIIQTMIYDLWSQAVARFGLGTISPEHGVTVVTPSEYQAGSSGLLAEYFTKSQMWTIADEVVRSNSKTARGDAGRTPFALLMDSSQGDLEAGDLYREYSYAVHGMAQLRWTPKLRDTLGLEPLKTDEELALERKEVAISEYIVPHELWYRVVRSGARAVLLEMASTMEDDQLDAWLLRLPPCPWETHRIVA
jgi:hypothetical protein